MTPPSLYRCAALAPFYGQTVTAESSIGRIGLMRQSYPGERPVKALRADELVVNGQPLDIGYLWLPLGPTAAARVAALCAKGHEIVRVRFRAVVLDYESRNGPSYCLERLHESEALVGEKWRGLTHRPEEAWGRDRERFIDRTLHRLECLRRVERQRESLLRYAAKYQGRRYKTANAILNRYFLRGEPLSDRQFDHVRREVGDAD